MNQDLKDFWTVCRLDAYPVTHQQCQSNLLGFSCLGLVASWPWPRGLGLVALASWPWPRGLGLVALWPWPRGPVASWPCGLVALASWPWPRGLGLVALASWPWPHGFVALWPWP